MESRGIPCGACRLLRRKCLKGCVFAPYFCTDEIGVSHFGAIHKVFGASNFSKMLIHLPEQKRYDAVVSVLFEAQARLQDPVYGCASHIYALQHQVANLTGELTLVYAQLASCSSLDGASLNPEYVNGKQSEMPSSISYSNSMSSPYDRKYFPLKSIPSENVSINNDRVEARDDERSWSSSSVCMKEKHSMSPICALATCHQTDAFQKAERSFEQKRMNNNDGDLETLAFNVIRGSCAPLTVVCPAVLGTSVLFNQ